MIDEVTRSNPHYLAACEVIRTLHHAGHEAYLVGGCVRDLLLTRQPHDWDVVTSALPDIVEALFPHTIPVGKSFGVITVLHDGIPTQVASLRQDGVYHDARRPDQVQFGCGLAEDVYRRDFTMNGIVYDPIGDQLVDLTGGQQDLQDRRLRAIGNPIDRLREDPLRILRAIRFATTLEFTIDLPTAQALHDLAPEIQRVAWERIRDEILKILLSPRRAAGIRLLDEFGLLPLVLPEISALKGVEQPPEFHPEGDVFVHTLLALDRLHEPTALQALATLLHDIGKPPTFEITDRIRFNGHAEVGAEMARAVCQRLCLSTAELEEVVWLVAHHMRIKDVKHMRRSRLRRFLSEPHFHSLLVLARADTAASSGSFGHLDFLVEQLAQYQVEPLRPEPLLRGQHLIELGVPPGPIYGQILHQVEDAQLEGSVTSYEEALALARQLLG